jgi:hypothetical protein
VYKFINIYRKIKGVGVFPRKWEIFCEVPHNQGLMSAKIAFFGRIWPFLKNRRIPILARFV